MDVIVAFTICIALIALGDIISISTKAKMPVMAGIIVLYLIAVSLGMPKIYPEKSGLAPLGNVLFPIFVAALTTNILPRDLVKEWKFIVIGCVSSLFALVFTIFVGGILFDLPTVFSGAVVTCGGAFTGGMLVMDYAKSMGVAQMFTLPLLLATTLDVVGQPVGSFVMRRYVKKLVASNVFLTGEEGEASNEAVGKLANEAVGKAAGEAASGAGRKPVKLTSYDQPYNSPENPSPFFTAWVPPQYETEAVALFQLAITVLLAYWLGDLTGLGWSFMLVIIGLAGSFLGFNRLNMIQRTSSSGLMMCAIFCMVFQMLNDLSLPLIVQQIVPYIVIVSLSCVGLVLGGMISARLFGYDPLLGAVTSIGLFYFFPGIQNIMTEVTRSYARSPKEYRAIVRQVSTPAIITAFMGSRFCLLIATLLMPVIIR